MERLYKKTLYNEFFDVTKVRWSEHILPVPRPFVPRICFENELNEPLPYPPPPRRTLSTLTFLSSAVMPGKDGSLNKRPLAYSIT